MHRGFEAFDAAQLLVAIADLYPDSASGGRSLCRRVAPPLFTLFSPASHRSADLARMLWALGVLADPADPQLRQAASAIGSALRQCSRDMRIMHPKFTMLAMKGMAAMARGGLAYSDRDAEAGQPWAAFLASADTGEATAAVRSLESDTSTFVKRAAAHLSSSLSAGALPTGAMVQARHALCTVAATRVCFGTDISAQYQPVLVRVGCAVEEVPRREGQRSAQSYGWLREVLLQSSRRQAAAA